MGGHVAADADKSQAESIAKSIATGQVIANQIAVMPPGGESEAKAVNSDLDQGIEKNLHAAPIQNRLQKIDKYDIKHGVVTLTGEVNSESKRALGEQIASAVPNVKQVVNDLKIKHQKASSSSCGQSVKLTHCQTERRWTRSHRASNTKVGPQGIEEAPDTFGLDK